MEVKEPPPNIGDHYLVLRDDNTWHSAEIIDIRLNEQNVDKYEYYVHYDGHDRRLDEWVNRNRFDTTSRHKYSRDYNPSAYNLRDYNLKDQPDRRITGNQKRRHDEINHIEETNADMDSITAALEKEHEAPTLNKMTNSYKESKAISKKKPKSVQNGAPSNLVSSISQSSNKKHLVKVPERIDGIFNRNGKDYVAVKWKRCRGIEFISIENLPDNVKKLALSYMHSHLLKLLSNEGNASQERHSSPLERGNFACPEEHMQMESINEVPPVLFIYPPPPQTGGITIRSHDLACLNEGRFINDAIIDFYLEYVFYEKLSDYHREKTHMFNSYFYLRLIEKTERACGEDAQKSVQLIRHNMVKRWTKHVDIFSKDFIVIPLNQNRHWFLAIICYPGLVPEAPEPPPKSEPKYVSKSRDNVTSTDDQEENKAVKEPNSTVDVSGNNPNSNENSTASSNSMFESDEPMPETSDLSSTHPDKNLPKKEVPCICIFDSLNGPNHSTIATILREYLEVEWNIRKGTRKIFDSNTMQDFIMQCPQQNNYSDCGIYLLQYVESFFESPLPYFDNAIPNLTNWFPKEKVAKKRQELKDLILALKKKYGSTTLTSTTNCS